MKNISRLFSLGTSVLQLPFSYFAYKAAEARYKSDKTQHKVAEAKKQAHLVYNLGAQNH